MRTTPVMVMQTGALYYGDCLEVMSKWQSNSVDLIYLDPPFNSKVNYNVLFGAIKADGERSDLAQLTAFSDTWEWNEDAQERVHRIESAVDHPAHLSISSFSKLYPDGNGMLSYLSYMAQRLAVMRDVLKETGSIYLHCDPTASHYLKIIMDDIFAPENFRNEIIWGYEKHRSSSKQFRRNHDVVLFYSNGKKWSFNPQRVPLMDGTFEMRKPFTRPDGSVWKPKAPGKQAADWWYDIPSFATRMTAKERLGYPTQKPLALLDRIIQASSNEGDIVLDPFCGCGTTVEAAHNLNRKWVGIDISTYAIEVIRRERLNDMNIPVHGVPKDINAARHFASDKPFDFEKWAVTRIRGFAPNTVQVGDGGIDGRAMLHNRQVENRLCVAQVKGGAPNVDGLRAFCGKLIGGKAGMGVFITLDKWDTPSVRRCVAEAGKLRIGATEYNKLVMYSIDEHFNGITPPLPPLAHPRTGEALHEELLDLQD